MIRIFGTIRKDMHLDDESKRRREDLFTRHDMECYENQEY